MRARVAAPLGLGLLIAVSAVLRTRQLDAGLWIDEGLSIGIADRPLADIPGALRQDGSPPLYYLLLHGWMGIVGNSEAATRSLSLLFALLAVPVAWWAGRLLFGERAGWIAAVLVALNPFITEYAQETRMYTLVGLLGLVATTCWLRALSASQAAALGFGASLAAMLYTHNWALFFGAATAVAWLVPLLRADGPERGRLLRTGALAYGGAAALYLPWLPSLLYQAAHTGAPWSNAPGVDALVGVPARVLGDVVWLVLALAGAAGAVAVRRRGDAVLAAAAGAVSPRRHGRTVLALALVVTLTVLLAWLASQITPAWAPRYLAAVAAPALLLCAAALSAAGRVGLAGIAVAAIAWTATGAPAEKSNVRSVIAAIAPELRAGDVVVSTRPSEVPVLRYYLPDGLRYATLTGPVPDPGLADQRDIVRRLAHTSPVRDLRPLVDELPAGRRLVLVEPIVHEPWRWDAPSTSLVRIRSQQWWRALSEDRRLRVIHFAPLASWPRKPNPVRATVYVKDPFSIPRSRRES